VLRALHHSPLPEAQWRVHTAFDYNITNARQAKQIVDALQGWIEEK